MAEANPQFSAGEIRRALQEKYTDIIDVLDANQLSSVLFSKFLISREDFQNLKWENHRAGSMAQAKVLVKKLLQKSDQDLEKCIEIVVTHQPEIRNCIDGSKTNLRQGIRRNTRTRPANHGPAGREIISWLTLTAKLAATIAVCVFLVLQRKERAYIIDDFRHVNQKISEVLGRITPSDSDYKLEGTDVYTVPGWAHKMALVNDTIWIPHYFESMQYNDTNWLPLGVSSIAVINLHCTEVNRLYFPEYKDLDIRSVLQVNKSVVLLASNLGLFVLNSTGEIQYRVAEGSFHDMGKYNDKVIALQEIADEEIWLHSLKYDTTKWIADKFIIINNIFVGYEVTMVYDEFVYICSRSSDKIYKYTLDGVLQQAYGGPGSSDGDLSLPFISAIDPLGTLLVSNWGNHRLVTLSAEGEWREYRPWNWYRLPIDVIIVDKSLYMLVYNYDDIKVRFSDIGHLSFLKNLL